LFTLLSSAAAVWQNSPPPLTAVKPGVARDDLRQLPAPKSSSRYTPFPWRNGQHQDYEKNRASAEPLSLTNLSPMAAVFSGNICAAALKFR
jgi:hypothetical protein